MNLLIGIVDAGLPINGRDLTYQPLGGAESCVYSMARALADIGHDVHVICHTDDPGTHNNVVYHSLDDWPHLAATNDWDVLIANRNPAYLTGRIKNRLGLVWTHEYPSEGCFENFQKYSWALDSMFVMSNYQAREWTRERPGLPSGWLNPVMYVTRNGIDTEMIRKAIKNTKRSRDKKYVLYGSRPERGLQWLLDMWPEILKEEPNLELHLCTYSTPDVGHAPEINELYKLCDQMAGDLGESVTNLGILNKSELYQEMAGARALLYPCHWPEISCILAMEAMACGLPVITTDAFALPETVGDAGVLIEGRPRDESYRQQFIEKTLEVIRDDVYWKELSTRSKDRAATLDWSVIAQEWNEYFHRFFEERFALNKRYIVQQMVYESDLVAARRLAQEYPEECATELPQIETWLKNSENEDLLERYANPASDTADYDHAIVVWKDVTRFQMVVAQIPEGSKRLLDVACNVPMMIAQALEKFPEMEAVGIDSSQKLIDQAKQFVVTCVKRPGAIKLHLTNIKEYDDPDGFDVVTAMEIVEHIPDTKWIIERLETLCKPGGRIILTLPYGPWEAEFYFEHQKNTIKEHVHHFGPQEVKQLFGNKKKLSVEFTPTSGIGRRGHVLGNWVIAWTNDPRRPLGEIDWEWKTKTTRPYQRVSGSMIVSNEEDWILGSIKAVSDVVDELVCFVNKSKDDTKFLIERWAAKRWLPRVKVIEGDWDSEEGFAAARNKALAVSDPEADWHLWWDADERLVGAHALHRYLNSPLYPGYIIPQNHLMLDMKAEPDQPVRIFRRDARAKFVGVIHEHPEFEVNQPLEPMLMMGDVQFAHYGYLTERVRREKCVMRNIPLLLKDREKNPERLVGLIFLQRDYIHCAEWHMHSRKALGPEALKFLRGVVEIYHDIFQKLEKNLYRRRWWSHSFSFYQKALMYLGSATESISETVSDQIPFQVASFLSGGYGGMSDESGMSVRPEKRWFCSADEFQAWNTIQADNFSKVMHVRRVGELLEGPDGT